MRWGRHRFVRRGCTCRRGAVFQTRAIVRGVEKSLDGVREARSNSAATLRPHPPQKATIRP